MVRMEHGETPDTQLLAQCAAGDRRALAAVLGRHAPAVTRYAWALVASQLDVEEVVQDTFFTFWRKSEEIVLRDSSLLPWLLATCRNLSLNLNRARARRASDPLPGDLAAASQSSEMRDRLRWVMKEIEALSPLDRRICELCLIEGRSYAEAAEETGMSIGAVRQRVARSRTKLRKAVTENED
jgi:RNA polymerase sigma factor (sigma-70 family)